MPTIMPTIEHYQQLEKNYTILHEALVEISLGQGAYSMDQAQHARNCIANMKELAKQAISQVKGT